MPTEEGKFTFEDWRNHRQVDETSGLMMISLGENGYPPLHQIMSEKDDQILIEREIISENELQKIRGEQLKAVDRLFDHLKKKVENDAHNAIENASDIVPYLDQRLTNLKQQDQQFRKDYPSVSEKVFKGEDFSHLLDPDYYTDINQRFEMGVDQLELDEMKTPDELHPTDEAVLPHQTGKYINLVHEARETLIASLEFRLLLCEIELTEAELRQRDKAKEWEKLTRQAIYQTYWKKVKDGGIKEKIAYQEIESWLLDELGSTKEEIKKRFNIGLEQDNFIRSARNNM